jgi:hypothetical protein
MKTDTWTHPYLRCSQCKGPAEATDRRTPTGQERTCRCLKGCQQPKTYPLPCTGPLTARTPHMVGASPGAGN